MDNQCVICLEVLEATNEWTLPCNHQFHKKCIVKLYRSTKSKYIEETFEPLTPECPLCRARIRLHHLPGDLIRPVTADLGPILEDEDGRRPQRLSRSLELTDRQRVQRAIDDLVDQRRRAQERRLSRPLSQPLNLVISELEEAGSSDNPIDLTISATQASPLSPEPRPGCSYEPVEVPCPSQQEIQMSISIHQQILTQIDRAESVRVAPEDEPIRPESPQSVYEEDVDPSTITVPERYPMLVTGYWGRGRNTYYSVVWDDGYRSLNRTKEVERVCPEMLKDFRKRQRAQNTARWRANKAKGRLINLD